MWKKRVALLLAVVTAASCMAGGCAKKTTKNSKIGSTDPGSGYAFEKNKEPVTLSVYIPTPGTLWEKWGQDPVSKKITELTGISFKCISPTTNDDQKLSLMIASNQLPDLVINSYGDATWSDMVKNNELADMESLAKKYTPDLKTLISSTAWEYARGDDGKVHRMIAWVRSPEQQKWVTDNNVLIGTNQPVILMRQDYYAEIGSPEIKNAEQFEEALEKIKQKHPDCIPFYEGNGSTLSGPGPMLTHFGIGNYYNDNGTITGSYRNPQYLSMYKWMNDLATKGLLTKDSFVDTSTVSVGKTKQGLPAAYTWTVGETGKVPANNPDTTYQPMQPWDTYEQFRTNAGYLAFAVSASSSKKDRVMDFIEFSNTDLGAKTMVWGVEGTSYGNVQDGPHFHYVNGLPKYFSDFLKAKIADWDGVCSKSGLDTYRDCLVNDVLGDQVEWDSSDPLISKMNSWYASKVKYTDEYIFNIPAGSQELVVKTKIASIIKEYNVKMVFAKNSDEVTTMYNQMLSQISAAGESSLNTLYTQQWQANKKRLGIK